MGFMREYDPAHVQLREALTEMRHDRRAAVGAPQLQRRPRPVAQIVGQSMVHDFHSVRFVTGSTRSSRCTASAGGRSATRSGTSSRCAAPTSGAARDRRVRRLRVRLRGARRRARSSTATRYRAPMRAVRRRNGARRDHHRTRLVRVTSPRPTASRTRPGSRRSAPVSPSGRRAWDGVIAQAVVDAVLESFADRRHHRGARS